MVQRMQESTLRRTGVSLDGTLLLTPVASAETPRYLVVDKRGLILESFADGSGFAHKLLKAEVTPPEAPNWYTAPDLSLDPTQPLVLSEDEKAAMDALRAEAEAEKQAEAARLAKQYAEQEARAKKLEEAERKREEKRKKEEERRREKQQLAQVDLEAEVGSLIAPDIKAPEQWVDFVFENEKADMRAADILERTTAVSECADLLKLEPRALMGRLKDSEIQCLNTIASYRTYDDAGQGIPGVDGRCLGQETATSVGGCDASSPDGDRPFRCRLVFYLCATSHQRWN